MESKKIVVTSYKVNIGSEIRLRCALVSDLHDRCPDQILALLKAQHPDLILIAGDLMERHEKEASPWTLEEMDSWQGIPRRRTWLTKCIKVLDGSLASGKYEKKCWNERNGHFFLQQISKIAPVFMGVGNHEWYFTNEDRDIMEKSNIVLLDNEDCEIIISGLSAGDESKKTVSEKNRGDSYQRDVLLRIGGLSTRYDLKWLDSFSGKPGHKILICHHPDYYEKYIRGTGRDTFDLIVSGHTHGGQWRLFRCNGKKNGVPIFAPGQGIFPKYAYGQYGKLIISSGVSNTTKIPRFGNPCELVMIELY